MKKTIFGTAFAATLIASGAALAADIQRGPAPYYNPPSSLYNWGGVYAGLNLGYQWGKVTNTGVDPSGLLGGGQIGVNWQSGQFVYGAETDIQISGADDTFAPWKFANPWFGTLRGRAGVAFNNVLLYATLGLAFAGAGVFYPFFGTLLGWLGVALTGSDTSSNILFGNLQKITSEQLGLSPILMGAANSSGGVMGKMIDAQSIVVASTATNWFGHEGTILRFVFKHSIALACLVGVLVMLQAYVFTWMIVTP